MSDGSKWQIQYRENTDDFEVTVTDDAGEHIFYLNYSDMDWILRNFSDEMNGE